MKYWIFQNNQVLGPYAPDEMGKISVFSPESLVCPEGRRGTSMGDWQRAGMVPDLSVALVRASAVGGKSATLSIAGLPPEPTLKDLAQLGSIQEKVAMLEEVVLQLQDGLRAKDAELSSVHQQLAGKNVESSEIKSESDARQRESDQLKRQIAGLEERLASVLVIGETLEKAVQEEKRVEQDVEKQGQILFDLTREVEGLRRRLEETASRPAEPEAYKPPEASPFAPASLPAPSPFADIAPPAPEPVAAPLPAPVTLQAEPSMEFPTINAAPLPSLDTIAPPPQAEVAVPAMPEPATFVPMPFDAPGGTLAPDAAFVVPSFSVEQMSEPDSALPKAATPAKGKKALVLGAVLGLAGLGGLAVMGGFVPGLHKPKAPAAVLEPTPLPPPEPVEAPAAPPPDSRQLAIELTKAWKLSASRTLGRVLEELAPSSGNLSPWMAETLMGNRVQVNYFARSTAPGAPTIAYEFEVDLDGKTLVGRNAAAKSVLTGKAAPPPAPPKPKPVRVKAKVSAPKPPEDDTLDSMLGDAPTKAPAKMAKSSGKTIPLPGQSNNVEPLDAPLSTTDSLPLPGSSGNGSTLIDPADASSAEGEALDEVKPKPRANPAKRAAKAKGGKAAAKEQPADESLLDDLLKE